jgi:hypothetical protein
MKKLTVLSGGKSQKNSSNSSLRTSYDVEIKEEASTQEASISHIQDYLEDCLTPALFDMSRQIEEMDRKYERLLRLLAEHVKSN